MDKRELRKQVRAKLAVLGEAEKIVRSERLCQRLVDYFASRDDKVVALFAPLDDEVCIWPLVEYLSCSCTVVLPRIFGDVICFYPYSTTVQTGAFGILEPVGTVEVSPCEIDAMVVPGVAFTEAGARMGRGKGYYDKYISSQGFRAVKIGVCFAEQIVDTLPVEPHDVAMDSVYYV